MGSRGRNWLWSSIGLESLDTEFLPSRHLTLSSHTPSAPATGCKWVGSDSAQRLTDCVRHMRRTVSLVNSGHGVKFQFIHIWISNTFHKFGIKCSYHPFEHVTTYMWFTSFYFNPVWILANYQWLITVVTLSRSAGFDFRLVPSLQICIDPLMNNVYLSARGLVIIQMNFNLPNFRRKGTLRVIEKRLD